MRKIIITLAIILLAVPAMAQNHTGYRLPEEPKRAKYVDYSSLTQGFWFAAQLSTGVGSRQGAFTQADLIAGYRASEFFRFGPGVSPQVGGSGFAMPIYMDFRGNIISQESRMVVPYWSFDAGYTVGRFVKGLYLAPTGGIRVGMPRNDFIAGLGYVFQGLGAGVKPSHGFALRLGFEF